MAALQGALAARVFLCFAYGYFLSYAFRSINAVIAPSLLEDVGLSNADLGLLSSAYFLSFAAMQLPLGIWLDKYGPRRTEAFLLLFAAAGAAIFASSSSPAGLWLGRALIGIGVSACLMAPYTAYRQWFPAERQSQLAGWMLMSGTSGALAATVPVEAALPLIGWRGVFWVMSAMILVAAACIFFLLRNVEREQAPVRKQNAPSARQGGYGEIFRHPYFRRMALLGAVNSGSFSALQTLWAGPWMMTVLDMSKQQSAQVLFAFNFTLMLSYLWMSWWAPRRTSMDGSHGLPVLRVVAIGITGSIATQTVIILSDASWSWLLWVVLTAFVPVTTLMQTSVSLSFPTALAGRANSAYNLSLFIGAFVMQWGIGVLIDIFGNQGLASDLAMRMAFAVCLGLQVLGLIAFFMNRAAPKPV